MWVYFNIYLDLLNKMLSDLKHFNISDASCSKGFYCRNIFPNHNIMKKISYISDMM